MNSYFFGSIYTLSWPDLWLIAAVTVIVTSVLLVTFKEMFLLVFDEDAAGVSGLPVKALNLLTTMLTALVIGVAIKIVGALLVSALLTVPVACSLVVGRSFRHSVWIAVIYSEIAVVGGLIAAGVWSWAPGATVVLTLIVLLILSLIVKRGLRI